MWRQCARPNSRNNLADLRKYCRRLAVESYDSARLAALYGEIAELLKASGVATTHFSPGPTLKLDVLQKTSLRIKCEGSFEQVASVLTRLEKMRERLWIEDVNLETLADVDQADSGKDGQIAQGERRCQVNLVIFIGNSEKFGLVRLVRLHRR